jgi:hypothetical protein
MYIVGDDCDSSNFKLGAAKYAFRTGMSILYEANQRGANASRSASLFSFHNRIAPPKH